MSVVSPVAPRWLTVVSVFAVGMLALSLALGVARADSAPKVEPIKYVKVVKLGDKAFPAHRIRARRVGWPHPVAGVEMREVVVRASRMARRWEGLWTRLYCKSGVVAGRYTCKFTVPSRYAKVRRRDVPGWLDVARFRVFEDGSAIVRFTGRPSRRAITKAELAY